MSRSAFWILVVSVAALLLALVLGAPLDDAPLLQSTCLPVERRDWA